MTLLSAPAKINLGLRVLGRRSDGYHEIESLFLPLDLADEIRLAVEPARHASVQLRVAPTPLGVPGGGENLAARAAAGFLEAAGLACRVEIDLTKRIPVAAGLGGGSSDAGAVLRGLAARFPDALGPEPLARLALGLGADVPFFLDPRPAWVRGVGERLEPVDALPSRALLLANPGVGLATAEVYRAFDALHPQWTPRARPGSVLDLRAGGVEPLGRWVENDLEAAALRLCPAIGRLQKRLRDLGALAVGMSGSGATLFGMFEAAPAARTALAEAAFAPPVWARVATTRESG